MKAGVYAFVVIIWVLSRIITKSKKGGAKSASKSAAPQAAQRQTPSVELHRPVPSMQRREPAKSAHRDYAKPEAYCVSCELSGEDHFVRDRQRRIAQLDEWLKNGLIDRQEYLVLKRRFQNDQ